MYTGMRRGLSTGLIGIPPMTGDGCENALHSLTLKIRQVRELRIFYHRTNTTIALKLMETRNDGNLAETF